MNGREFLTKVVEHEHLHLGEGLRDDRVYVVFEHPELLRIGWELEPSTIREHPWETLRAVLTNERRPDVISHYARIVGYYSNMRNWNGSKLAEARDRAKGDYAVAEGA